MRKSWLAMPHALVLMFAALVLACLATVALPAGTFTRETQQIEGGRSVTMVVPNSYASVAQTPVGPFGLLASVQKGLVDAADVIFFVFLVGAAFATIERTGAIEAGIGKLLGRLDGRALWALPPIIVLFSLGGATFGMSEETIAFVPMFLLLSRRMGLDKTIAVSLCFGAATVGYGFAPLNPFSVGIAQGFAELPPFSGLAYRAIVYAIAVALFAVHCHRHARRVQRDGVPVDEAFDAADAGAPTAAVPWEPMRHSVVWLILAGTAVVLVIGVVHYGWYMQELSMLFLATGLLAGVCGGLGANGTAEAFVRGFRDIAFGALIIGFARAIKVVLEHGNVIDTLVHGLFTPLSAAPAWIGTLGMFGAQAALHFVIPSSSGQATATMPIVIPLCDLLGITRQTAILAFQYGDGVTNFVWPTQATLVAVLATAGLPFDRWMRFILPYVAQIVALAIVSILVAHALGLGPA